MKIDNLEIVLKDAGIERLPAKWDKQNPFKYAIGKMSTNVCEEAYCLLNMYNGEPNVRKCYVGGLFKEILAVYPYEYDESIQQEIINRYRSENTDKNLPYVEKETEEVIKGMETQLSIDLGGYKGDWGIEGINSPEEARTWLKKNKMFGKANIKNVDKLREEMIKIGRQYYINNK